MKCSKCGKEIANDSLFCEYCGAKVVSDANPSFIKCFKTVAIGLFAVFTLLVVGSIAHFIYNDYVNGASFYVNNSNSVEKPTDSSDIEIVECDSPETVARNFVTAIVNEDYKKMEKLTSPYFLDELYSWSRDMGLSFSEMFTEEHIHDISGMRPILAARPQKYFLTITWSQTIPLEYEYSNGKSYSHLEGYSVSFDCVDSDGYYYSGDHDTSARVVLVNLDNAWRVAYFK